MGLKESSVLLKMGKLHWDDRRRLKRVLPLAVDGSRDYLSGVRVPPGASLDRRGGVFYRQHLFLPDEEAERRALPTEPEVQQNRRAERDGGPLGEE